MNLQTMKRQITVDEYHKMGNAGIFNEDEHLELIKGEIIKMAPIGSRHASCVDRLNEFFVTNLAGRAVVRVQNPIYLDECSELEPDIVLARRDDRAYATRHPRPDDVFLIVEVAETSIDFDREVKIPLYAKRKITEIWLVNLIGACVEIYQNPAYDTYQTTEKRYDQEVISPSFFPDVKIDVKGIMQV